MNSRSSPLTFVPSVRLAPVVSRVRPSERATPVMASSHPEVAESAGTRLNAVVVHAPGSLLECAWPVALGKEADILKWLQDLQPDLVCISALTAASGKAPISFWSPAMQAGLAAVASRRQS